MTFAIAEDPEANALGKKAQVTQPARRVEAV